MLNATPNEEDIFYIASRITEDEARGQYLLQACKGNPELHAHVERMLRAYFQQPTFLENSNTDQDFARDLPPAPERVGSTLGSYKILEKIAEGGMGVVYVAEQTTPVRRKVALKVIRPGMAGKNVVARFEAERQALAMMNHPNIARVFDGGATDEQLPYFVMELVQGLPITEYCDQKRLTIRERLELFQDVCRAVQHAHQKGIIHRDLKPSNVLVAEIDGKSVPKVIDFGVAKALNQQLSDQTLYTQFAQMIGTPLYMSPEQAGLGVIDVDTRSDVYSLGVMLYELLTGATPFTQETFRNVDFDELRRIIREEQPRRLSAAVSTLEAKAKTTIADRRNIDSRKLCDSLRGELDWLVMKALEKDRERRYQSASALADDIERYLTNIPVKACPPTATYAIRKFALRHRAILTGIGVCLLALVAGIVATSWQMFRAMNAEAMAASESDRAKQQTLVAESESRRAESEATIAIAINRFLMEDLLSQVDHTRHVTPNPDVRLREVVDRAAKAVDDRFQTQPIVRASIQLTLSSVYESLGEFKMALDLAKQSLQTRQEELGADAPETLKSKHAQAWIIFREGQFEQAEQSLREVYEAQCRVLGNRDDATLRTLGDLATVVASAGRLDEAEKIQRELLETRQQLPGPRDENSIAVSLVSLGMTLDWSGQYDEAIEFYGRALEIYDRIDTPSGEAMALGNLASVYLRQRDYVKAEELLNRSLELKKKTLGDSHYWTASDLGNLGVLYGMQGKLSDSERCFREALATLRHSLGNEHPQTIDAMKNLSISLLSLERFEEAAELAKERLEAIRHLRGEEDPQALSAIDSVFESLRRQGKTDEAFAWQHEQLELTRRTFGNESKETIDRITNLAAALASSERYDEAEVLFREALELRTSVFGADDLTTLVAAKNLEILYLIRAKELAAGPESDVRETAAAVDFARKAIELRLSTTDHSDRLAEHWKKMGAGELLFDSDADPLKILGVALYRDGQWQEAIRKLEEANALAEAQDPECGFCLAMAYSQIGEDGLARQWYDRSLMGMNDHASSDDEVKRLQTEAARMLGITDQTGELITPRNEPTPEGPKAPDLGWNRPGNDSEILAYRFESSAE